MIGTLLNDRFRLERKLGSGGMSTVYRAFDETLERWVAIKVMHGEMSRDADQLERFRREARAVARLSHPHVVSVIDAGEDAGHPYIVLEYIEGETLKARIRRDGPLPIGEAVAYAIEIGLALSAAHRARLVHRDVKPQNILIDPEGRARITDFGIARSLEAEGLTQAGRVVGTTDYVSPEQAMGKEVSGQSDIYSLGVCLYEMLTGQPPFVGDSHVSVAMKHVQEPIPDVRERRPEVSASLAGVLEHATAKELANRYPEVDQMIAGLEDTLAIEASRAGETTGEATAMLAALPERSARMAPARLRRPGRYTAAMVVLIVLALGVGAAALFVPGSERLVPLPGIPEAPDLVEVPLTPESAADFDPEGDGDESSESVGNLTDGNPSTIWATETYQFQFGPDGQKSGVGAIIDAGEPVAAKRFEVASNITGWSADIYAANGEQAELADWGTPIASITEAEETERVTLDTAGQEFSHYLLWITQLPEDTGGRIELTEVGLER